MPKALGEFEMLILYALLSLGEDAYGASVRREIESRTGRSVSAGSVYTVLERLENRGLISSWIGDPTARRGGRRKKHYRLDRAGVVLLHLSQQRLHRMAQGLTHRLQELYADLSS